MYSSLDTGEPEGVLNDYDLASLADCPTTNTDRTGTLPFMALPIIKSKDGCLPRMYKHDAESFFWVFTYISLANVKYIGRTIHISRSDEVNSWFGDNYINHHQSKGFIGLSYNKKKVHNSYKQYRTTIRSLLAYWVHMADETEPEAETETETETEVDNPEYDLKHMINGSRKEFYAEGFGDSELKEFEKVEALLLAALGPPKVA